MNHVRYWLVLAVLSLILASGIPVLTQESDEIPQITIEVTREGFRVPTEIPEGIVQVTFENNSEALIGPLFARLNEGVTLEGLFGAMEEQGEEAFLQLLSLLGYLEVMPGAVGDATFDFTPGQYLLLNFPGEEPEEIIPFTVADVEAEIVAAPESDVEIDMVDFAFNAPIEIAAGRQVWHIENRGSQPHEFVAVLLEDNLSAGAFNELLLRALSGDLTGTPEPVIYWISSPGEQGWITYDLEPGTYAVLCGLPDMTGSGHVHTELGMRQIIIVSE